LGYAVKFLRILLLIFTALFDVWGFVAGTTLIVFLLASNRGLNGKRSYLYPLIPFEGKALLSLLTRIKKPMQKHMESSK
jgi:stage V sporulation protein AF